MIPERTLKQWRKLALLSLRALEESDSAVPATVEQKSMAQQIIRMTQELLDQHLIQKDN